MLILAENIRLLRSEQQLTQQALSDKLHISRSNLTKYEGGRHDPPLDILLRISRYFKVSVDVLLTVVLKEEGIDKFTSASDDQKMIFPIQVDHEGNDVIEVVTESAKAGYAGMYSDPGFIEELDHMELPFLELRGKCRAFPVEGDSMPPFDNGAYVIGRYISSSADIRDGKRYILISRESGILFKRVNHHENRDDLLLLYSDNPIYKPFDMSYQEVIEVWEFVAAISFSNSLDNYVAIDLLGRIRARQDELERLVEDLVPQGVGVSLG